MADKVIDSLAERILELEDYRPARFAAVNESDTLEFVVANKNKNTVKATGTHIRLFQSWLLTTQNENRPVQDIPVDELDTYIRINHAIKRSMHGFFRIAFRFGHIGHICPPTSGKYGHIALLRRAI
jgi:hypothetical protein